MSDLADLYPVYASHWIDTSIGKIFLRAGGSGPPLLSCPMLALWGTTGLPANAGMDALIDGVGG